MASAKCKRLAEKYSLVSRPLANQRGAAIVLALLISAAVLAVSAGVLNVSIRSTEISGTGKSYGTVEEAADGAVNVIQDAIYYRINGGDIPGILVDNLDNQGDCFDEALINFNQVCTLQLDLPGTLDAHYNAHVTIEHLYSQVKVGGRIEFPPSTGGAGNNLASYYRISAEAVGPKNLRAEKNVLYRLWE